MPGENVIASSLEAHKGADTTGWTKQALVGLGLIGSISLNNSLISAVVERWRRETFHFPCGEMTITLDEVSLILGVTVDGKPVVNVKDKRRDPSQVCQRLLGKLPKGELSGNRVTTKWLKESFAECPKGATRDRVSHAWLSYIPCW